MEHRGSREEQEGRGRGPGAVRRGKLLLSKCGRGERTVAEPEAAASAPHPCRVRRRAARGSRGGLSLGWCHSDLLALLSFAQGAS